MRTALHLPEADGSAGPIGRALRVVEAHLGRFYLVYAAVFLLVTASWRLCFDYLAYLLQWRIVVDGRDPWTTPVSLGMNAYGPLHNLYGLLFLIHPRLPRIFGSALWLAALWPVVRHLLGAQLAASRKLWLLLGATANPFIWGWVAEYGSNDALVAAALVASLLMLRKGGSASAGVFVALAGLVKFYPMLVVPFLAFDRGKLDLRFAATALGVFAAGMAAAGALWGPSVLAPLLSAAGREPSQLSIWEFLTASAVSPLHGVAVPAVVTQGVFAAVCLLVFVQYLRRRVGRIEALALGLITILTAYPLGHFQFYLPLVLVIPLTVALTEPRPQTATALTLLLAVVSLFALCYEAFGGLVKPPWLYIRQTCSLPTLAAEVMAIAALLRPAEAAASPRARLAWPKRP